MKDQHVLILFPLVMLLIIFVGLFMNTTEDTERTLNFIFSSFKDLILRPSITGFIPIDTNAGYCDATLGNDEYTITIVTGLINCGTAVNGALINQENTILNCNNKNITGADSAGYGMNWSTSGNNLTAKSCISINNFVKNGIGFKTTGNVTIIDTDVHGSGVYDIVVFDSSNITLLNVTYRTESVGANSNYTRKWYFNITVQYVNGSNANGATVTVYNHSSVFYVAGTDSNGFVKMNATHYINHSGTATYFNIYKVNATDGQSTATNNSVNLSTNVAVTLNLDLVTAKPNVTNLTWPYNNTNISSSTPVVEFNFTVYDDYNVSNCTFYTNISSLNQTLNITYMGTNNSKEHSINITSIPDGLYIWNVFCLDNTSKADWSNWNNTVLIDTKAPLIYLESPADAETTTSTSFTFNYNATDNHSDVNNCSLILGSSIDQTISTITESTTQTFSKTLTVGIYTWKVNCTDYQNHIGNSSSRTLTISQTSGGEPSSGGSGGTGTPKKEEEKPVEPEPQPETETKEITESQTEGEIQKPTQVAPPSKAKFSTGEKIVIGVSAATATAGIIIGITNLILWLLLLLVPFLFLRFKHYYIAIIDLNNILKFKQKQKLKEFLSVLEKNLNEKIIGEINNAVYQKFNFRIGYMDLSLEDPLTLVAHFSTKKRADHACEALKATLEKIIPDTIKKIDPLTATPAELKKLKEQIDTKAMFINSIKVEQEHELWIKRLALMIKYMFKRQSKVKQFIKIRLGKDLSTNITQIGNFYSALDYLMKLVERKFKEKIWYIGYDFVEDKPTENFIFDKGGNLKFVFDKKVKIEADLPKDKITKLKDSVNFAIKKMLPKKISMKNLFDIDIRGY